MYRCPKCGKDIRYMAAGFARQYSCDPDKISVVTDSGHLVHGYKVHLCGNGGYAETEEDRDDRKNIKE